MPRGGVGRKRRAARMALGMRHAARTAAWRCAQGQTVDWGATVHQGLRLVKEPEMEWARSVLTTAWMPLPADAMVPTCCHMLHHMIHAACPHLPHAVHDRLWRSVTKRFRAIVSYFTIRCGGAVTDQIAWRILPEREPREFGAFTRRRAWLPSLGSLWGSNHNGYKMVMLVALVV